MPLSFHQRCIVRLQQGAAHFAAFSRYEHVAPADRARYQQWAANLYAAAIELHNRHTPPRRA